MATAHYITMAKTYTDLFPRIYDFQALHAAYLAARKGKRDRREVQEFELDLEGHLIALQNELIWGAYRTGTYRMFTVSEPKERLVAALPFRDRVLQHSLVAVIEPIWERRFIDDSYACRRDKGVQRAVARVQHFLRVARRNWGDEVYVLKADISRYFASILHPVLMREVERVISDPDVLWVWRQTLTGYGHENGLGLPVGALTSQLGANIVLNRLDHVAKDQMSQRFYVRYMDDFIAVLPDKATAQSVLCELRATVHDLGLELNPKTAIHPWQRGVDFCGYRTWPTHILPRKRNIKRARQDFRRLMCQYFAGEVDLAHVRQRVASFVAYAKHCDARETVERVLGDLVLVPGLRDAPVDAGKRGISTPDGQNIFQNWNLE